MRDRRKALEGSVIPVHRRMEIHDHVKAHKANEIEPLLRKVVSDSSEGLVLKNPRSAYRLSERNDDWWKVKPEYMTEFGEALDCVIIGGYYGSGHRGGMLSSFMCGLRASPVEIEARSLHEQHCVSFFKVGGGMCALDYKEIREATEGKWKTFDPRKPPTEYITLAGGDRMYERPDMWIKPSDSVVVEVKAASVSSTDQFAMRLTLRFPRFKRLRSDKSWNDALSVEQFLELKNHAEQTHAEKEFLVDDERKKRRASAQSGRKKKKPLIVHGAAGDGDVTAPYAGPDSKVFEGVTFFIVSEALKPFKKTKQELEQLIKANGGAIVQSQSAAESVICVADKNVVKASAIKREGRLSIVRPAWLYDCIEQSASEPGQGRFLLPMEPLHMLHIAEEDREVIEGNVDEFGDSYCRDINVEELRRIFGAMSVRLKGAVEVAELRTQFEERLVELPETRGSMFGMVMAYIDTPAGNDVAMTTGNADVSSATTSTNLDLELVKQKLRFGGAKLIDNLHDSGVTHIIFTGQDKDRLQELRDETARKQRLPRIVTVEWVVESWREKTLLAEERFLP
jgi:DNA ligase-4